MPTAACPICDQAARLQAAVMGRHIVREFLLYRCPRCRLTFVGNPVADPGRLYTEAYYRGEGADPGINFTFELEHPAETVRQYEWRGILAVVRALQPLTPEARWLDYGCGHGGLVQYVNAARAARACGYDEGAIVGAARERGIPILGREECLARKGAFDVVTAIEVLEHVTDPLAVIAAIRALLKPGGLFFYTTGNARPHRKRFVRWSYVVPEIHNCYFEPETAEQALRRCGLRPDYVRRPPGWTDIIRYKVLKNLGVRRRNAFEAALPWSLITRIVDARYGVTHFPVGWAASGLCRSPASPLGRRHGDPPHLGAESPNR